MGSVFKVPFDMRKALSKILLKAFRISKGTLKTLPIFHFTEQRIEVFCCFIAYKTAEDRLK